MTVLVIGGMGNMGRRYCSILSYLQHPFRILDKHNLHEGPELIAVCDKYIIASPTSNHLEQLKQLLPLGRPILCEKPLSKSHKSLKRVLEKYEDTPLCMVVNYVYAYALSRQSPRLYCGDEAEILPGLTSYDYYNSGGDGLIWDCIQLYNLAEGPIELSNDSPFWRVNINGVFIQRDHIDRSYVLMVSDFIAGFLRQDMSDLIDLHKIVEEEHERYTKSNKSKRWYSGTDYQ
jgi:hypothetical protein